MRGLVFARVCWKTNAQNLLPSQAKPFCYCVTAPSKDPSNTVQRQLGEQRVPLGVAT